MREDDSPTPDATQPVVDWWDRARQVRERIENELGGREYPDISAMIRSMREKRDIQILSTVYGEERAPEMVLGADGELNDA